MKPSKDLTWFVGLRGVTLCSRNQKMQRSIPYPYAGLWALLANGNYNPVRAARMMSLLMSVGIPEAEQEVTETLTVWQQAGILSGD